MTSGTPVTVVESSAPAIVGLIADVRRRGPAVTLAAAGRSSGVTTAITYDVRVGTSICDSAARISSSVSTIVRFGATAATMRQRLDGICVNTIVFTRPKRLASHAATGKENAARVLDQKKNTLVAVSERSKRSKSHSAISDCTAKPPANESMLNSAAIL